MPLRVLAVVVALAVFAGFMALGTWQVERRTWKLALIERVENQLRAVPVEPPASVDPQRDEYRRLRLAGVFLNDRETLVQASTELGGGFWVLTPLRLPDGRHVLVNRGFVTPERRDLATRGERAAAVAAAKPAGAPVALVGLLRVSEPGGGFMRRNDPAAGRWHSRDVAAIAQARGLADVLPYFVDAEASAAERAQPQLMADANRIWPVAGLTVIRFNNHHLVYAITWYGLALMVALAAGYVGREWWRERRPRGAAHPVAAGPGPHRP